MLLTCHFFQDGVARQNWRQFNEDLIQNYCRKDAYECKIPRQKVPRSFKLVHYKSEQRECDVFSSQTIPPYHVLQNWNQQLLPYCELAKGFHYIETSQERYSLKGINSALLLDRARSVKASVEKELDWFAEPFLTPKSVTKQLPTASINNFKSLLLSHPCGLTLPEHRMNPKELAFLCCDRYISCDHVLWIVNRLNRQQDSVYCIYLNYAMSNPERLIARRLSGNRARPSAIVCIVNVGREANGKVFLGRDGKQGNHWATIYVDPSNKCITYCDSLGWPPPENMYQRVNVVYRGMYGNDMAGFTVTGAHDFTQSRSGCHFCNKSTCASYFPFQTCAQVCGVAAIVVAAIATLSQPFFRYITTVHHRDSQHVPRLYIQQPTKYAKFLRRVIISWIGSDLIDISLLVPQGITLEANLNHPSNVDSDSDEDEDVVRGANTSEIKQPNIKEERMDVGVCENVKETEKSTEKKDLKQFVKQRKRFHPKKSANEQNLPANRHICSECKVEFTRGSNLRRHILKVHPNSNVALGNAQDGNCCCLSCNYRCRRIVDLRKHLTRVHNQVFRTESLSFSNNEGNLQTLFVISLSFGSIQS